MNPTEPSKSTTNLADLRAELTKEAALCVQLRQATQGLQAGPRSVEVDTALAYSTERLDRLSKAYAEAVEREIAAPASKASRAALDKASEALFRRLAEGADLLTEFARGPVPLSTMGENLADPAWRDRFFRAIGEGAFTRMHAEIVKSVKARRPHKEVAANLKP